MFQRNIEWTTASPLGTAIEHFRGLTSKTDKVKFSLLGRSIESNDRMHDSDRYIRGSPYLIEASTYLWYPWSLAVCTELLRRPSSDEDGMVSIRTSCDILAGKRMLDDSTTFVREQPFAYVMAENLFALAFFSRNDWMAHGGPAG